MARGGKSCTYNIYSMYRRCVLRYMYQDRQSGWHYFIGRKNSGGWSSRKAAGHKVSITRDLVVLGVSSVNPRGRTFLISRYFVAGDIYRPRRAEYWTSSIASCTERYRLMNLRKIFVINICNKYNYKIFLVNIVMVLYTFKCISDQQLHNLIE